MSEAGAAEATRGLESAHRALLAQSDLQFHFSVAPKPPQMAPWLKALLQGLAQFLGPVLPYLFWGAVILGAAAILIFVTRELLLRRKGPARGKATLLKGEEVPWRPEPAQARQLLAEADALAGQGLFEEAAHLILLRSIEDIRSRRPGAVRPSLTSRDIALMAVIPPPARALFIGIAQAVERSLFGGRPLGEAEFRRCRADYEAFAVASAWS